MALIAVTDVDHLSSRYDLAAIDAVVEDRIKCALPDGEILPGEGTRDCQVLVSLSADCPCCTGAGRHCPREGVTVSAGYGRGGQRTLKPGVVAWSIAKGAL